MSSTGILFVLNSSFFGKLTLSGMYCTLCCFDLKGLIGNTRVSLFAFFSVYWLFVVSMTLPCTSPTFQFSSSTLSVT